VNNISLFRKSAEIAELLKSLRPFFTTISTPKTAKIGTLAFIHPLGARLVKNLV
jgi:hypothetical protein